MLLKAGDIAIIGMACRFPGANDYLQYWDNLAKGINSIKPIPAERWDINKFYSPDIDEPNKSISKWCGLVENVDRFDSAFFNIPAHEAKQLDPQQRILLEETWHCLEDAGVTLHNLQENKTAVFIGAMNSDYRQRFSAEMETDSYACLGSFEGMLANRISHAFHFNGASLSINAACASSLVAVHEAKRSLLTGESDYALAGGVNLNLHPWKYISFSKARMLSPDGQCKTFDQDANGYVPGDGVGVVLLQRLEHAIRDGNHIYGILKGSAVNHGGKALSVTAPRVEAQREVILAAYADAGITPETTGYVEAHGTGTSLGDPIEIEALTQAFRRYTNRKSYCKVGSVKTNIGHLEAAAGIAGMIKVLLMMKHRQVPRHLNLTTINPIIDFSSSPFTVATEPTVWQNLDSDVPLRAGVSSFGFGGANAHIVLEQYTGEGNAASDHTQPQIFALSAKTPEGLDDLRKNWRAFLPSDDFAEANLRDISATLLTGRVGLLQRMGKIVNNKQELTAWLSTAATAAKPFRNQTQEWCLLVGEASWNGHREIAPAFEQHARLRQNLDYALDSLARWDEDGRLTTAFRQDVWPEAARPLYSFLVHYAFIKTLTEHGFAPKLAAGERSGSWLSLVISGMMNLADGLGFLAGKRGLAEIALARPQVPCYDPVANQRIEPYLIDEAYIRRLLEGLNCQETQAIADYFAKARLLQQSQYTFKRYLAEWDQALAAYGYKLDAMLEKSGTNSDANGKPDTEQLLLLFVVMSSLHKLNRKWNLTEEKRITNSQFNELLRLVDDEVMPKEALVELLACGKPDYQAIASAMHKRQERLQTIDAYPFLKEHNRSVAEIGDAANWLQALLDLPAKATDLGEWQILQYGDVRHPANPAIAVRPPGDLAALYQNTLLELWLQGCDVEWAEIFPQGSFRKVAMPTSVFQGESYWMPIHSSVKEPDTDKKTVKLELKPVAAAEPKISLKPVHDFAKPQSAEVVLTKVTAIFSEILDMESSQLDQNTDLLDLGIDSISGVEAIRDINQAFGLNLEAVIVYDYPTIAELSDYVQKEIQRKN